MNTLFKASHCFLCNFYITSKYNEELDKTDIFGDHYTLTSNRTLDDVLNEILDEPVLKGQGKSSLCKKCFKTIFEYDLTCLRVQEQKSSILNQYNVTQNANKRQATLAKVSKVIVPASKLKPLPPQYVILDRDNVNLKKVSFPGKPPSYVLKVREEDSFPVSLSESTFNITTSTSTSTQDQKPKITLDGTLFQSPNTNTNTTSSEKGNSMPIITVSSGSILNFQMSVPNNFLDSSGSVMKKEDDKNIDEAMEMEIDEECSYALTKTPSNVDFNKVFEDHINQKSPIKQEAQKQTMLDMIQELDEDGSESHESGQYVVRELQYLHQNDGNDDNETIVMSGDGGAVIKVLSSDHLLYDDQEISLIIPQDGNESQDSNEDSQIELQVSGDEETANAIIAAANEQGGAFIKVESGEMYRVKSVKSKTVDDNENDDIVPKQMLVTREGDLYKCQICANLNTHIEETGESANAKSANFSTTEGSAMTQHFKLNHNTRIYICTVCGDVFRKRVDFNKHYAQHEVTSPKKKEKATGKKYECPVCKKKCGSTILLEAHKAVSTACAQAAPKQSHVCTRCNKIFASKYTHQAHMKTHQDRPRPFSCKTCRKSFFTQANLTQHEKTHWGVKDFICKFCNKAFGTQHNLDVHGVVHSGIKPFLCGVCGKAFARKAEIRDHIRVHTGERPFACTICGATFSQRSNLQSHVRATHSCDRRHSCDQCDKRFKRRRLLEYHIRASHTGERPYRCAVCQATFVYPEHYKKHKRIHSGEKPYVCEVCGKSFNTRDNRNAHRFVHSDKKPYECLVCGAGYMRKPLLIAHMNTSGHLTESIVVNQPRVTQEETGTIQIQTVDSLNLDQEDKNNEESQDDDAPKVYITTNGEKKIFLQGSDGKPSLNLVLEGEDEMLTQNLVESSERIDASILDSITSEDIEKGTQIVANDENGGVVRLVQIQLPNGGTGWIAIN